jgi:hypothetical protein
MRTGAFARQVDTLIVCWIHSFLFLYYSVFKSSHLERNSKAIGIVASGDFSDSRKPTADSPGLPDFPKALRSPNGRSPTSDFLAGFRLLASLVAAPPRYGYRVFRGYRLLHSG